MAAYRYVGGFSFHEGLPNPALSKLGQKLDLSDEMALELAHCRIDIITEAQWSGSGITDDEAKSWPTPDMQARAPEDFIAKKKAVVAMAQKLRTDTLAGLPVKPVIVEPAGEPVASHDS